MRCRRVALLTVLLALVHAGVPAAEGQSSRGPPFQPAERAFHLEQNHPNPVNPETWIPFHLEESLFADADTGYVSIRIVNILRQLVAVPVAVGHPAGKAVRVSNLPYDEAGRKLAYWNGRDTEGERVPSGVYYCELEVNGRSTFGKMIVVSPRRRRSFLPWLRWW